MNTKQWNKIASDETKMWSTNNNLLLFNETLSEIHSEMAQRTLP